MYPTILIATDLTESSDPAVSTAIALASRLGSELVVAHVIDVMAEHKNWFLPDSAAVEAVRAAITHETDTLRERLAAQMQARGVTPTQILVRHGHPGDEIPEIAEEVGASLIVIGTHGRRGFRHAVMGSVAERVARIAGRPVLVIPTTPA